MFHEERKNILLTYTGTRYYVISTTFKLTGNIKYKTEIINS